MATSFSIWKEGDRGWSEEKERRKEASGKKDHLASYQSLMKPDIINKLVISVAIVIPIIC